MRGFPRTTASGHLFEMPTSRRDGSLPCSRSFGRMDRPPSSRAPLDRAFLASVDSPFTGRTAACDSKNVPSQTPKKPQDKRLFMKLEILDAFETATPTEQDRLRKRWNSIPNIQDIDSVIAAARRARKNAKPYRVK